MHANERMELDRVSHAVIACAHRVQNALGTGFLEKVYENAMLAELEVAGLGARQQVGFRVEHRGRIVGEYVADLIVQESLIVEIKACTALNAVHRMQCLNYLKASNLKLALLVNFGQPKVEVRRIVNQF